VGQKVREIIGRVQARVDVAVNKLVDLVAKQGNDWLAKAGKGRPSNAAGGSNKPGKGRPSNAAGGSNKPGSQRPVPPNRTGQPPNRQTPPKNSTGQPQLTPADIRKHEQMAIEAVQQLKKINGQLKDYKTTRTEKIAQAQRMKPGYDRRLKSPIKFNVHFESNIAKDKADNDLDFKVVIAPNTTTKTGSVPTKEEPDLPETKVTDKPKGNKAGSVTAEPLTRLEGKTKGSRPTEDYIPGWNHVLEIDYGDIGNGRQGPRSWVKMHLLSQELHGPGEPWNLVPGRKTDNDSMERGPESDAKTRIKNDEVLYYEVSVTYHTGNKIVEDFPATIDVKWGPMKKKGESFVRDKTLEKHWPRKLEKPPLDGATALVIDLSTAGRKTLYNKLEIPERLARNIADESKSAGPFKNKEDFITRMQAFYAKVNVDFQKTHWPLIEPLINSGKAVFRGKDAQ
jgi:hypothetical protein